MNEDFPENMEDFVTLDELAEDEDARSEHSDSIGTERVSWTLSPNRVVPDPVCYACCCPTSSGSRGLPASLWNEEEV